MQIDYGIFLLPLPENDKDQRQGRNHRQNHDEVRFKPIFALTLIEDDLKCAKPKRDESQSDVIDVGFASLAAPEVRRILNQPGSQQDRQNPDGNIDEENPAPGEIVGNPSP